MGGLGIIMTAIIASIADVIISTVLLLFVNSIYTAAASMSGSQSWLLPSLQSIISILELADALGGLVFILAIVGGLLMIISVPFDLMGRF